jgi:predicted TIM-barrel fold metal-dependent hydrolase
MTPLIIDAHAHLGEPGVFFAPLTTAEQLLALMDRLEVRAALCTDHASLYHGCADTLPGLQEVFERSGGRLFYLGVFHPGRAEACLAALAQARAWSGFAGIKLHPSFHHTPAEDPAYAPAWRFAADHDLPMLTHSWSASSYNPVQALSTPARFERYVQEFPAVRLVLGHAGGRGQERADAVRLAADYPQVYLDLAGDIFCYRLLETLLDSVPADKLLFASDYPWLDPRANLSRVLLSEIPDSAKRKILGENARRVYRLEVADADH